MDGVYGYNEEEIYQLRENLQKFGYNIIGYLTDGMQNNFVNVMAENWFCVEAQEFFKTFSEETKKLVDAVNDKIEAIDLTIANAAIQWQHQLNNGGPVASSINTRQFRPLDVSGIKENLNGVRGINRKNVPDVLRYFNQVRDFSRDNVNLMRAECTKRAGFLGGEQTTKLNQYIDAIANIVYKSIEDFTIKTDSAINASLNKYGEIATEVASKFSAN